MNLKNTAKLISSVAVCQAAGIVGSVFTAPAITTWYAQLIKPEFNPPSWLFAPVWIILYTLMGVSLYLILKEDMSDKKIRFAVSIFAVQLTLNAAWSFLFFGLKNLFLAFLEILILWAAVIITIRSFYSISRTAGLLLLPYILWVSFAAVLNFSIWILNM